MDVLTASVGASVAIGISLGLGFAADKFNLEARVLPFLPADANNGTVVFAGVATLLYALSWFLSLRVSRARRVYGVAYPHMYPISTPASVKSDEHASAFMAVVRAHENFLETNAQLCFALALNLLLFHNAATMALAGAAIVVGRALFAIGYAITPLAREPGFLLVTLAEALCHGTLAWHAAKVLLRL